MNTVQKKTYTVAAVILLLIIVDQLIKYVVKTNYYIGEDTAVTSWCHIRFVENNGMAFGMEFVGKLFLTLFRLFAVGWIGWKLVGLLRQGISWGFTICVAFLIAGAIGNVIDCLFYGLVFSPAQGHELSHLVAFGDGYGEFLKGRVVDMFYFPLFEFDWPSWIPVIGGHHFLFFDAIFNFADACITCSIGAMIIFYRHTLAKCLNASQS